MTQDNFLYILQSIQQVTLMCPCYKKKSCTFENIAFPRLANFPKDDITYFLVVVRLPFTMRVDVETDLKLPIPPPMLSIPSRPPKEDEKEVKSTEEGQTIRQGKQEKGGEEN